MAKKVEKQEKKVVKKQKEFTIRQYFYINKRYEESLIGTFERTHHDSKKTEEEWKEIMRLKKIIFN